MAKTHRLHTLFKYLRKLYYFQSNGLKSTQNKLKLNIKIDF